jgi:CheY-like chemotaxis protein
VTPSPPISSGPWNVLFVSGSVVDQKLISGLLRKHHHQVTALGDGRLALTHFCDRYDVVVLDPLVPGMDGIELIDGLRQLQRKPHRAALLVLADEPTECSTYLRAGADACLMRPLQLPQFQDAVLAVRRGPPPAQPGETIDWSVTWEAVGGRRELLDQLVEIFQAEYPPTLAAIGSALADGDAQQVQTSAHQLKGCLRYFGSTTASELARKLEDLGRSRELEGAARLLRQLEEAIDRLLPQIVRGPP